VVAEGSRKGKHMGIMRTKSVEQSIRDTEEPRFQPKKALGLVVYFLYGMRKSRLARGEGVEEAAQEG
jgi:hypothetical protein